MEGKYPDEPMGTQADTTKSAGKRGRPSPDCC